MYPIIQNTFALHERVQMKYSYTRFRERAPKSEQDCQRLGILDVARQQPHALPVVALDAHAPCVQDLDSAEALLLQQAQELVLEDANAIA